MVTNDQLYELDTETLEEYYPKAQLATFSEIRKKTKLAKKIGTVLTQDQFEQEMPVIFNALQKCWENAYQD